MYKEQHYSQAFADFTQALIADGLAKIEVYGSRAHRDHNNHETTSESSHPTARIHRTTLLKPTVHVLRLHSATDLPTPARDSRSKGDMNDNVNVPAGIEPRGARGSTGDAFLRLPAHGTRLQRRHLHLDGYINPGDGVEDFLRQFPNLETLDLRGVHPSTSTAAVADFSRLGHALRKNGANVRRLAIDPRYWDFHGLGLDPSGSRVGGQLGSLRARGAAGTDVAASGSARTHVVCYPGGTARTRDVVASQDTPIPDTPS
ncbi:uncharacterized protein B0I36DRAFT_350722 [Microdochium trichocladiopsis]|uniref:Uncharacterized protein n=1 Tax=Microdochium trichocladiopsis TaxID=1682393 RepID=A0A9P8Y558_9PEZI|nr:uncharacterized protein B0I36DRAFT_350722 [Microdochium trichocladiopsis]KAH7029928.1 hypothetical protein B0I36DRAFT_350722 [Microdochium trichocladiopsis]